MKHSDRHSEFGCVMSDVVPRNSSQEQLNSRVAHHSSHQYISSPWLFLLSGSKN